MECVSPRLLTPRESQSSRRPWIAVRLICQAVYFKRPDWLCCSPQRDCFREGYIPKGGVLGMWQIETCTPEFVFLYWSDVCADSKLQPSPLHPLMCCLLNHPIRMFSFLLLCAASHMTLKGTYWCVFAGFTFFYCKSCVLIFECILVLDYSMCFFFFYTILNSHWLRFISVQYGINWQTRENYVMLINLDC